MYMGCVLLTWLQYRCRAGLLMLPELLLRLGGVLRRLLRQPRFGGL